MAAVRVVLPWSMCPIVPTFTCGLVRSNFFLAICFQSCIVFKFQSRMGCCKVCCYFDLVASLFQLRLREIVGNSGKEINGDQSGDDGKVCLQSYAEFREVGSRTQTAL